MSIADYACADEPAHVFTYHADCLTFLRSLSDDWTHAIITDPPYGLADHKPEKVAQAITAWAAGDRDRVPDGKGFMGREWDAFVPPPAVWDECLRVLKPGGHLAVFAGSRTVDLMGLSIRLAGFEMRDGIAAWLYGSGFPKGLDVAKAITAHERHGGASSVKLRQSLMGDDYAPSNRLGNRDGAGRRPTGAEEREVDLTPNAQEWIGWKGALKPAHEPILLARKPLAGTVAANVLAHRAGALNVDACRVGMSDADRDAARVPNAARAHGKGGGSFVGGTLGRNGDMFEPAEGGRWPTNVVLAHVPLLDEHGEVAGDACADGCVPGCQVAALDEQSGTLTSGKAASGGHKRTRRHETGSMAGSLGDAGDAGSLYGDQGGASRFFPMFRYQAKAPKSERPIVDGRGHVTVKPLGLMRWLVRLLVPGPDADGNAGCVLDPFAGSGATLEAARLEGRRAVGVERDEHSVRLIAQRLGVEYRERPASVVEQPTLAQRADLAVSMDELMGLYREAVEAGEWCDELKAAFTARRLEIEGAAA